MFPIGRRAERRLPQRPRPPLLQSDAAASKQIGAEATRTTKGGCHEHAPTTRDEFLASVVKQYGAVAIAKHVLDVGPSTNITEHEFVAACGKDFVKLYTDPGEDGLTLRKALTLIKNAQWAAQAERGMRKVGRSHGPDGHDGARTITGGEEGTRTPLVHGPRPGPTLIGRVGNDAYDSWWRSATPN